MSRRRFFTLALALAFALIAGPAAQAADEPDSSPGNGWRLVHADVAVDLEPEAETMTVSGEIRLRLDAADASPGPVIGIARQLRFVELEPSAGEKVDERLGEGRLDEARFAVIRLPEPAARGDELTVRFAATLDGSASQLVVQQNVALASWTAVWFPIPFDDSGAISISGLSTTTGSTAIAMPAAWSSLSEGSFEGRTEADGRVTERWTVEEPLARSFAAGPYAAARHESDGREVGVYLLTRPPEEAGEQAASLAESIAAMEERYGPFPFGAYGIAEVPEGAVSWYAASQQGFLMARSAAFGHGANRPLFAHEAAHAWWGNAVGTEGPGSILGSESLAQYGAVIAIEAIEGEAAATEFLRFSRPGYSSLQSARGYFKMAREGHDKPLAELTSGGWDHNLSDAKGHWMYHMLRRRVGDETFFATLRGLFARYRGGKMRLDDLRAAFVAAAPEAELESFFEQWLERTGAPRLEADWEAAGDGEVAVTVRQVQEGEPYHLRLDLALDGVEGEPASRHRVDLREREQTFRLAVNGAVAGAVSGVRLDPDYRLLIWTPEYAADAAPTVADLSSAAAEKFADGLISDFEDGTPSVRLGSGWRLSTDSLVGGRSQVRFQVVDEVRPGGDGAPDSRRALRLAGEVEEREPPRWAGATWQPGGDISTPFDLSERTGLRFLARATEEAEYMVALYDRDGGFQPSLVRFTAGPEWRPVEIPFADFEGIDTSQLTMVMIAAGPAAGPFELAIDDFRVTAAE